MKRQEEKCKRRMLLVTIKVECRRERARESLKPAGGRVWESSRQPSSRFMVISLIINLWCSLSLRSCVAIRLEDPPGACLLIRFLAKLAHTLTCIFSCFNFWKMAFVSVTNNHVKLHDHLTIYTHLRSYLYLHMNWKEQLASFILPLDGTAYQSKRLYGITV